MSDIAVLAHEFIHPSDGDEGLGTSLGMSDAAVTWAHEFIDRLVFSITDDGNKEHDLSIQFITTIVRVVKPRLFEYFESRVDQNLDDEHTSILASLLLLQVGGASCAMHACASGEYREKNPMGDQFTPRALMFWSMKSAFAARTFVEKMFEDDDTFDILWETAKLHYDSLEPVEYAAWKKMYDSSLLKATTGTNGKSDLPMSMSQLLDSLQ